MNNLVPTFNEYVKDKELKNSKVHSIEEAALLKTNDVEIYKNPKTVKYFKNLERGIIDSNGDLYLSYVDDLVLKQWERNRKIFLHEDVAKILQENGLIKILKRNYYDEADRLKFIGVHAINGKIVFSDSFDVNKLFRNGIKEQEIYDFIDKFKKANPGLEFVWTDVNNYRYDNYTEVEDEIKQKYNPTGKISQTSSFGDDMYEEQSKDKR
jgi:hypothetical protein